MSVKEPCSQLRPWALQSSGGRTGAFRGRSARPTPCRADPRQDATRLTARLAEQDQGQSCTHNADTQCGRAGPGLLGHHHPSRSGRYPGPSRTEWHERESRKTSERVVMATHTSGPFPPP